MTALPTSLGDALQWARQHIASVDAKILLRSAANVSAATLVGFPERPITPAIANRFTDWVQRRAAGEPVAYLLGTREFYGRDFRVNDATLIPRPETELLVELALERLRGVDAPRVLDLGTGTGAIGITLALELHTAAVTLVDYSAGALAVAQDNAARLGARVECLQGSWLQPVLGRRFDLMVSNPPYIEEGDPHLTQGDVRFEPRTALIAGPDGLSDIRHIVDTARAHLNSGGWLLLEHGYNQAPQVSARLIDAGFSDVASWQDIASIERCSGGKAP